jgi:hypothetical protein
MSEPLKYHYSNPKFDGKPRPAEGKKDKPMRCVKARYTQHEAAIEIERLDVTAPEYRWTYSYCVTCKAFHVWRDRWRST